MGKIKKISAMGGNRENREIEKWGNRDNGENRETQKIETIGEG